MAREYWNTGTHTLLVLWKSGTGACLNSHFGGLKHRRRKVSESASRRFGRWQHCRCRQSRRNPIPAANPGPIPARSCQWRNTNTSSARPNRHHQRSAASNPSLLWLYCIFNPLCMEYLENVKSSSVCGSAVLRSIRQFKTRGPESTSPAVTSTDSPHWVRQTTRSQVLQNKWLLSSEQPPLGLMCSLHKSCASPVCNIHKLRLQWAAKG